MAGIRNKSRVGEGRGEREGGGEGSQYLFPATWEVVAATTQYRFNVR